MLKLVFGVATGQAMSAGLSMLVSLFLINVLTKSDYGSYYFYYALLTFSAQLPGIAINNGFAYQFQYTHNREDLLYSYIGIKLAVFVLTMLIVLGLSIAEIVTLMATLAIAVGLLFGLFDSSITIAQAKKKYRKFSLLQPVRNLLIVFGLGLAYLLSEELTVELILGVFLTIGLILVVLTVVDLSLLSIGGLNWASIGELVQASRRFFIFEVSAVILARIEVWILGYFATIHVLTSADIAEYGAGFTFGLVFPIISSSITSILVTKIVPGTTLGQAVVRKLLAASAMALVFSVLYAFVAYQLSRLIVPEKFTQLHWIIPMVTIGMWMSFCTNYARVSLLAHNSDRYMNAVYTGQVVIGIVLSFGFTGWFGLVGSVIAFCLIRLFALILVGTKFLRMSI